MKRKILHTILIVILLAGVLFSCQSTKDENLDRPVKSIDPETMMYIKNMGLGWNAGNTLEAIGGETAWGNPMLHQTIFDAVKAAGFDTVRLPVAWSKFSDETNFIIDSSWMARVTEVVHCALNAGLYVIINIHWDGGWIQPT
jgi:aryl-phospho-beta-D-glucosidase BglC (GH1 family)